MRLRHCVALLVFSGLVAAPATGFADTLAAPTGQFSYSFFPGNNSTVNARLPLSAKPETDTISGTGLSGQSSIIGGADPEVTANLTNSNGTATGIGAYLTYQFQINGPADQLVSIDFSGAGGVSVSDPSTLGSSATLWFGYVSDEIAPPLINDYACIGNTYCPTSLSNFSVDQTFDVHTNTALLVSMYVYVSGAGGSASAFIDPTITLDTKDPAYSLEFSPGLSSPVPEPSSLLLLTTGLLGGTAAIRRRCISR